MENTHRIEKLWVREMTQKRTNALAERLVKNVGKWQQKNDSQVKHSDSYKNDLARCVHLWAMDGVHIHSFAAKFQTPRVLRYNSVCHTSSPRSPGPLMPPAGPPKHMWRARVTGRGAPVAVGAVPMSGLGTRHLRAWRLCCTAAVRAAVIVLPGRRQSIVASLQPHLRLGCAVAALCNSNVSPQLYWY